MQHGEDMRGLTHFSNQLRTTSNCRLGGLLFHVQERVILIKIKGNLT